MQSKYLNRATDLAKDFIRKTLHEGDVAIDATVGNGNDTIFLCKQVGESGRIYGFDIQEMAINSTIKKLEKYNFHKRTVLVRDGHENLTKYVKEKVSAIMFNLGYLPGGNHEITTNYSSTILGVKAGIELLKPNGIITIVIYPGHAEGYREKEEVLNFLSEANQDVIDVLKLEFINQVNNPPILLAIEKK